MSPHKQREGEDMMAAFSLTGLCCGYEKQLSSLPARGSRGTSCPLACLAKSRPWSDRGKPGPVLPQTHQVTACSRNAAGNSKHPQDRLNSVVMARCQNKCQVQEGWVIGCCRNLCFSLRARSSYTISAFLKTAGEHCFMISL